MANLILILDSEKFSENVAECLGIQAISKLHMELWTKEKVMREQLKDFGSEEEAPEEMSCICPGEGELSIYEAYFQEPEESAFSYQKEDIFVQEEEKVFHMLEEEV